MKKLKLFVLGAGLVGMTGLGIFYFGASEAEAQGNNFECEWNGEHCKNPSRTNMCGCEKEGSGNS